MQDEEQQELTFEDGYAELHGRDLMRLLDEKINLTPEEESKLRKYVDSYMHKLSEENKNDVDRQLKERELYLKEKELELKEQQSVRDNELKKEELKIHKKQKDRELDLREEELEQKDREIDLREKELEMKEKQAKLEYFKVAASIIGDLIGVGELIYSVGAAKDYYMEDFAIQNDGFLPGQLAKEGKMMIDTNLRNNLPR